MKVVEAQAGTRKPIKRRCLDRTTERAGCTKADIVDQHDHDVRCFLGALTSNLGGALAFRTSSSE